MAKRIDLQTFTDERGNLTVIEKVLPFPIHRIFYVYGVDGSVRGGHRHHQTVQAAVCLQGHCHIHAQDKAGPAEVYVLDRPSLCVLLEPQDWHIMKNFSRDAILMVLASRYYDPADYIYDPYE